MPVKHQKRSTMLDMTYYSPTCCAFFSSHIKHKYQILFLALFCSAEVHSNKQAGLQAKHSTYWPVTTAEADYTCKDVAKVKNSYSLDYSFNLLLCFYWLSQKTKFLFVRLFVENPKMYFHIKRLFKFAVTSKALSTHWVYVTGMHESFPLFSPWPCK